MLKQQGQSQGAALGDTGQAVDMIQAKCQNAAAADGQHDFADDQGYPSFQHRVADLTGNVKNGCFLQQVTIY